MGSRVRGGGDVLRRAEMGFSGDGKEIGGGGMEGKGRRRRRKKASSRANVAAF